MLALILHAREFTSQRCPALGVLLNWKFSNLFSNSETCRMIDSVRPLRKRKVVCCARSSPCETEACQLASFHEEPGAWNSV